MVKAVKAGTVTVTVKVTIDGSAKSYPLKITVKKPYIVLSSKAATVKVGDKFTFRGYLYGVKSAALSWKSANTSIASITKSGTLTAKKAGTVTLTVAAKGITKTVKVKVVK